MSELILVKTLAGPVIDPSSLEDWKRYPLGKQLRAKITVARNLKHHNKLWKLVEVVLANLPEDMESKFPSKDDLMDELKIQTGYRKERVSIGGTIYYIPESISFSKMGQVEFSEFYDACIRVIAKHIIPGIDEDDLRQAASDAMEGFT